jgi:dolichyl-diphosphooligosaccharide--protein glycosyltransferase
MRRWQVEYVNELPASQVPVVGWAPLKSLEQLGPLGVFIALQLMEFIEVQRRKRKMTTAEVMLLRLKVCLS